MPEFASRHLVLSLAALFLVGTLPTPAAQAGCFRSTDLEEISTQADQIFVGRVRSVRTVMGTADGVEGPVPFQEIEVKVFESWKGHLLLGDRIRLRFPGGPLPEGGMLTVSSSPAVENHLETPNLFFVNLDRYGLDQHGLCFKSQGIYRVEKRPSEEIVIRGVQGHPIAKTTPLMEVKRQTLAVVSRALLEELNLPPDSESTSDPDSSQDLEEGGRR